MIAYNYEMDFKLKDENIMSNWISECIDQYDFTEGELNYIFCNDAYLLKLNEEFLDHDTLTDIISFDYTMGKLIGGDIFISVERVKDNASSFEQPFEMELARVMIHGVLHYMGFKDKTEDEKTRMRSEEDACLKFLKL